MFGARHGARRERKGPGGALRLAAYTYIEPPKNVSKLDNRPTNLSKRTFTAVRRRANVRFDHVVPQLMQ